MKKLTELYKSYIFEIWMTAALAACVGIMQLLNISCFFKAVTGIDCMSCGMTRAYIALLSGNIAAAFYYHPLFWTVPFIYLVLFFRRKFRPKTLIIIMAAVYLLFLAVYAARMFFLPGSLIYIG